MEKEEKEEKEKSRNRKRRTAIAALKNILKHNFALIWTNNFTPSKKFLFGLFVVFLLDLIHLVFEIPKAI